MWPQSTVKLSLAAVMSLTFALAVRGSVANLRPCWAACRGGRRLAPQVCRRFTSEARRARPVLHMAQVGTPSSGASGPAAAPQGRASSVAPGGGSSPAAPAPPRRKVFAYLHGFLSGPDSVKGRHLQAFLKTLGVDLRLLDLNGDEGFAGIRYSRALSVVSELYESEGRPDLTLIGSSLGGYVASRYAELHPDRVEKLVLFCPGYDLQSRWPKLFGEEVLDEWQRDGSRAFQVRGEEVRIPFDFIEDGRKHPAFPQYRCPALVVQGVRDEVVPSSTVMQALQHSRTVREKTVVYLVDDDHALTQPRTLETACHAMAEFLDVRIPGAARPAAADRIEVEQKYPLPDQQALEDRVRAMGGKFKGTVVMTDVYWDLSPSSGYVMSRANAWLRQRGGVWELKVPATAGEHPNTLATACYREITGEADIADWLASAFPAHFQPPPPGEGVDLEAVLAAAGAVPLAQYQTTRTKYSLEGGFGLDLDCTDFGYSLVEIELLCQHSHELPDASRRIGELAESLGLLLPGPTAAAASGGGGGRDGEKQKKKKPYRGKLEEYVMRNNAELHALLVQDGVFNA